MPKFSVFFREGPEAYFSRFQMRKWYEKWNKMCPEAGAEAEAAHSCEHAESTAPATQIKGAGISKIREKSRKSMRNRLENKVPKKKAFGIHFLSIFTDFGPFLGGQKTTQGWSQWPWPHFSITSRLGLYRLGTRHLGQPGISGSKERKGLQFIENSH